MLLQQYKVRCSKTANDHSHVSRVWGSNDQIEIKTLGLKAFFHGIQWTQKTTKIGYSVKYRRTEVRNLPRQSKHLPPSWNYSVYVQLTQGVWISFENPLNVLNAFFIPKCDFAWQNGVTGRLLTAQCCKKTKNSFICIFCLRLLFFKFVSNTITFSLIK